MVKFTNQQGLEIIKNYYRNSELVVATLRALTPIFVRNNRPTRQAVRAIVDKFETKFTLLDVPVPKRRRIVRSEEIIAAVSASILGLHAFKIKLTQELKPLDHLKRRNFSDWAVFFRWWKRPSWYRQVSLTGKTCRNQQQNDNTTLLNNPDIK